MTEFKGKAGSAFVLNLPNTKPEHVASLQAWIIHAPGAHPVWSHYMLSLVHLREIPNAKPAVKFSPQSTHEVMVWACDPDYSIIQGERPHLLNPPNHVGQFAATSDALALQYVEGVLKQIVDGDLSPDTDHRRAWQRLFPFNDLERL